MSFFKDRVFNGQAVWQTHSGSMEVVIAHPNGWGIREQGVLRTAAIQAGLSSAQDSNSQILFVSEAEASIQFCVTSLDLQSTLRVSNSF
jgi:hypothetical protein